MNNHFTLNFENLKSIPLETYEKNFTFIVDDQKYFTNRIVADILSPIIKRMHFTDKSVNEFNITTTINKINCESAEKIDYFKEFLQLSSYEKIFLDENRKNYFSEYFLRLGNFEEYFRINTKYYKKVTSENAIDYLLDISHFQTKILKEFHFDSNFSFNVFSQTENRKIIDFISQNFENINKKRMKELNINLIEQIISNESLQLFEEDTLLNFLIELYEKDVKYSPLFEYVIFSNVQEETLSKFVNVFNTESMNNSVWMSIVDRLFPSKKLNDKSRYITQKESKVVQYHSNISKYIHKDGFEFNGILRSLSNFSKGNIHENGTIEITSNSIAFDIYHPKNLVDYENDNYYFSKDVGNSFVCFDFKRKSVKLSSYSIKSHSDGKNSGHLKNWVIEVSDDGKSWKMIDKRENCSLLNGSNLVFNFNIESDDDQFHRFVRIRSIGNSWYQYGNHNQFYFSLIEFYGEIKDDN